MTINYLALALVTLGSCIGGAIWFGPLFGKVWMKLHHEKELTKEELAKGMKGMWKIMTAEIIATLVLNLALYFIVTQSSGPFFATGIAGYIWIGFVVPAQVSIVLWGNDNRKAMLKKLVLSSGYRLIAMLLAAYIFFVW